MTAAVIVYNEEFKFIYPVFCVTLKNYLFLFGGLCKSGERFINPQRMNHVG